MKLVGISSKGHQLLLAVRKLGDILGEIALFGREDRASQGEAIQPPTLLLIHPDDLLPVSNETPELARRYDVVIEIVD